MILSYSLSPSLLRCNFKSPYLTEFDLAHGILHLSCKALAVTCYFSDNLPTLLINDISLPGPSFSFMKHSFFSPNEAHLNLIIKWQSVTRKKQVL